MGLLYATPGAGSFHNKIEVYVQTRNVQGLKDIIALGGPLAAKAAADALNKLNENTQDEDGEVCEDEAEPTVPIPDDPSESPGEEWEWKGSGPPESGKGNWVNKETGQKLHPDLNHEPPKGPHWGLDNPNGSKWDYFPGKGWVRQ